MTDSPPSRPARIVLACAIAALLWLRALPAWGAPAFQTSTPAQPATPAQAPSPASGRTTYQQKCAPCHGTLGDGKGATAASLSSPPTAFQDYAAIAGLTPADMFQTTKNGRMARMMPPWGSQLSDQQIWDTVAYAWTLHTSETEVSLGKGPYDKLCASCHGSNGKGKAPAPDLTDFAAMSLVSPATWDEVVSKGRNTMPAFGDQLDAVQQRAVLEYVRSLSLGPMFVETALTGSGVISGTISNGTTKTPGASLEVVLGIFDSSSQLETRQTTADAKGFYRFGDLPTDASLLFAVRTEYPAGMGFTSDFASFPAGQTDLNLPLSVYETTTRNPGIRADQAHFIVEFDSGRALVAEVVVFSMEGDRAFVGDAAGVPRFSLPAGAQDLVLDDGQLGERYQQVEGGFVDTLPLTPGEGTRQVLYRYTVPYTGSTLDLTHTLLYPTSSVNALITDSGENVTSPQMVDQGLLQTTSGNFFNLTGQNFQANQTISLRFTNLPSLSSASGGDAASGSDRTLLFVLVGLAGLAAAALVAMPMLRGRLVARAGREVAGVAPSRATLTDRESLVDALARLEIAYEEKQIAETYYRDERLRLKAQLQDVIREEEKGWAKRRRHR